jgi:RNA polymerase sigma factor (sigma-70 family)
MFLLAFGPNPAKDFDCHRDLVERIRNGDREAESAFVTLFRQRVFITARVRTRDTEAAHDLTQDILFAVLKALRLGQLREVDRLPAFVLGTARNLINGYFRSGNHRPDHVQVTEDMLTYDPVASIEIEERRSRVQRELEKIDPLDREILMLTLIDGCKPGEIASRLNVSNDVVRARKSRAIKKIAEWTKRLSQTDGARH